MTSHSAIKYNLHKFSLAIDDLESETKNPKKKNQNLLTYFIVKYNHKYSEAIETIVHATFQRCYILFVMNTIPLHGTDINKSLKKVHTLNHNHNQLHHRIQNSILSYSFMSFLNVYYFYKSSLQLASTFNH